MHVLHVTILTEKNPHLNLLTDGRASRPGRRHDDLQPQVRSDAGNVAWQAILLINAGNLRAIIENPMMLEISILDLNQRRMWGEQVTNLGILEYEGTPGWQRGELPKQPNL